MTLFLFLSSNNIKIVSTGLIVGAANRQHDATFICEITSGASCTIRANATVRVYSRLSEGQYLDNHISPINNPFCKFGQLILNFENPSYRLVNFRVFQSKSCIS